MSDFKDYIELHPNASIVEMDTVIGTQGGKGGKCFLTLLFRQYNPMLIYLMPYKRQEYVIQIFGQLKSLPGDDEFKRLFEVILTDNGTEFSDPDSIELSFKTGKKLISLFYCDPNCSYQKGSIEKIMNTSGMFCLKEHRFRDYRKMTVIHWHQILIRYQEYRLIIIHHTKWLLTLSVKKIWINLISIR